MTDQTRVDFEAHFQLTTRQKWQHKDGRYVYPEIQRKWEGYQAGVAKAAPSEPVNGKEPAAYFWRDKAEGTVGLRFTMPEWVDSPDKQRYELVRLYAAPVAAAAPGADDAKDAARYRWLRACNSGSIGITTFNIDPDLCEVVTEEDADAAIDAAMQRTITRVLR